MALFDVDETLTLARGKLSPEMAEVVDAMIAKGIHVGIVGGSAKEKILEQVGEDLFNKAEYVFPENGSVAVKKGVEFERRSLADHIGEENMQKFIDFCLRYIADMDLPVKR